MRLCKKCNEYKDESEFYICNECNQGLGKFKDDIQLLQKAVAYLKEVE